MNCHTRQSFAGAFIPPRLLAGLALLAALVPARVFAAFGYTDNGTAFVVDTGAGLVFQVNKSDGTISSVKFNGTEYNGPSGKGSHIASGLGSTGTTVTATSDGTTYVKVTLQTDSTNTVVTNLTHYLIVRNGSNTIHMATYVTAEPGVGELRWITRLAASLIPNGPIPSNTGGGTAIESSDVFGLPDGTTRSKYYGDTVTNGKVRAMELGYCGATGTGIGVWMVFGNRESSSGGPFFRDIENQYGGTVNTSDQEIYNYMNSGHEQTEAWRVNVLHGPYALVFTTGAAPALPIDFTFMDSLGLTGWVPASGRGTVSGAATGIPPGFQGVVGLADSSAQYWAVVSSGSYSITGVKPGTYTATLYKGELSVATASVTVAAGATTTLNLTSGETAPSVIFRIGDWDGTPAGLLNADKIVQMHPSDVRMTPWVVTTFNVGADNAATKFPAIQFRGQNSPTTITFNLTAAQIVDLTLKVGIACAYNNGRPQIGVNTWTSAIPSPSTQPTSRSFTIGTWRGNNTTFTYTIPATALVVGTNTMTINPVSGSADLSPWLSAGWVYDAIELDGPTSTPTIPPAPTGLTATTASSSQINLAWTASSGATSYNVKRATVAGGPYTTIATGVTTTSYSDTGLAASTTYYYVVSAVNSAGESANSTEASATTQAAPTIPPAPTGLIATPAKRKISLSWNASSGATSYNVKRATVTGGPYTTIATGVTTTSYTNTGLTSGTTYYYVVSAVNTSGESPNSTEASATSK